jgi:hypothetical protein
MRWIYYVRGTDESALVGIGLGAEPETHVVELQETLPFQIELAGLEEGDPERLEDLKERFRQDHVRGMWYRPSEALTGHLAGLGPTDREAGKIRRVSIDLTPEEFVALEKMVQELGTTTKTRLIHKAIKFYRALITYKAKGYLIQAVKGGKLVQFPDLDDIR